jgi:methyl-accepting chemotaxis protein
MGAKIFSIEQAQGIEQVNKAVSEMDQVVQQNAANAEESASASEEMNAQAEQMKAVVMELVAIVGGSDKQTTAAPKHHSTAKAKAKPIKTSKRSTMPAHDPQAVIPFEDDQFSEF